MGSFTALELADAQRIAVAHGLGDCTAVVPITAGTVNSNYFIDTRAGRYFVRIYEQQEVDGVAYEWALVDFLAAGGVPLPGRMPGPEPGELRVSGKPVVVYRQVIGEDLCQSRVEPSHVRALGSALARAGKVGAQFSVVRAGRFGLGEVAQLLKVAAGAARPELTPPLERLSSLHAELVRQPPSDLPRGVVHGDLFRDNVLWEGSRLIALLDWESASDGALVYDLAVCILAWCCGDSLDLDLARACVDGYRSERELSDAEWRGLWWQLRTACLRFATTRIVDVYLRGTYPVGYKDYRRFLTRLDVVEGLSPEQLVTRLGGTIPGTG